MTAQLTLDSLTPRPSLPRTRIAVAAFDAGECEGHVVAEAFADDTRDGNDYDDPYLRLWVQ